MTLKEGFDILAKKAQSPTVYSACAAVGVVATAVLAIVCTRRQCKREQERAMYETDDGEITREEAIEEIKETALTYLPVVVVAGVTAGCIFKSDCKWEELNTIVDTSRLLAQSKLNNFRNYIPALALAEVLNGFGRKPAVEGKKWFLIRGLTLNDEMIFFESTEADVISAEYHLNRNFQYRGTASVKEFFAFLGIMDRCDRESGDYFGWDVGIMLEDWGLEFPWIDFGHKTYYDEELHTEITEITYLWDPEFTKDGHPMALEHEYLPYGYFPTE